MFFKYLYLLILGTPSEDTDRLRRFASQKHYKHHEIFLHKTHDPEFHSGEKVRRQGDI